MEAASPRAYRFDGFRLDLAQQRLCGPDGRALPLSGRAYDVLAYLIENRGRVVTKDDLLKAVWPRVVVEENNLNQAISTLRRALADTREAPRYILTVAGRGYRFIGDVHVETGDDSPSQAPVPEVPVVRPWSRRWVLAGLGTAAVAGVATALWPRGSRDAGRLPRSIAVLPFKPLVGSAGDEALEFGMAETLINRLSTLPGVAVTPLSSVRRYAGAEQNPLAAGSELEVEAVIEGHVQLRQDRVRLTARLLQVSDGTALWSGSFDERLDDFFAIQDSLANQVVEALAVEVPDETRRRLMKRYTEDVEAWQLYLNGRYQWEQRNEEGLRRALEYYEAAERRDPRFALPAAGQADVWAVQGVFGNRPPREAFQRSRDAAERAIALDPRLAEAHAALGHVLTQFDRDWIGGEREYRLALGLKPAYAQAVMWLANSHVMQGHLAEGLRESRQAQAIEPLSITFAANVGMILYYMRDYAAARTQLLGLVETTPQATLPRRHLARLLMAEGKPREALDLLEGVSTPGPGWFSDFGRACALDGRTDAALEEIARLELVGRKGFGVGYDIALIRVAMGEHAEALVALERGIEDHSQMIGFLNSEPGLDAVRNDPRLRVVSQELGLG